MRFRGGGLLVLTLGVTSCGGEPCASGTYDLFMARPNGCGDLTGTLTFTSTTQATLKTSDGFDGVCTGEVRDYGNTPERLCRVGLRCAATCSNCSTAWNLAVMYTPVDGLIAQGKATLEPVDGGIACGGAWSAARRKP